MLCEWLELEVENREGRQLAPGVLISLLLTDAPRKLHVSISPKEVMEGKKAVLTCESDANPPISQYTWFDWNNQNLQHYDRTLRLDPVKVQHSGAYRCEGHNHLGKGQSPPSTLTVYCKGPSSSPVLPAIPGPPTTVPVHSRPPDRMASAILRAEARPGSAHSLPGFPPARSVS